MSTQTVKSYQKQFAESLLSENLSTEDAKDLLEHIVPMFEDKEIAHKQDPPYSEAVERVGIYRNNVILSLITAMADTYPVIKRLLGDEFFNAIARDFVRAYPPQKPSLLFYGEQFIDFIKQHKACQQLAYLSDVAQLEWHTVRAFHAKDEALLDQNELAEVAPEKLVSVAFTLQPSVRFMQSEWPVDSIWQENLKQEVADIDLSECAAANLLVYRDDLQVQVVNLNIDCFNFAYALSSGATILQAWEQTLEQQQKQSREPLDESELSGMLGYLLGLSIFSTLVLP